jgi:hypothetical protein
MFRSDSISSGAYASACSLLPQTSAPIQLAAHNHRNASTPGNAESNACRSATTRPHRDECAVILVDRMGHGGDQLAVASAESSRNVRRTECDPLRVGECFQHTLADEDTS